MTRDEALHLLDTVPGVVTERDAAIAKAVMFLADGRKHYPDYVVEAAQGVIAQVRREAEQQTAREIAEWLREDELAAADVLKRALAGEPHARMANDHGIAIPTVSGIKTGRLWGWLPRPNNKLLALMEKP